MAMAEEKAGWAGLAERLKAERGETLLEAYRSTISQPFTSGTNGRAAGNLVDDLGIESLNLLEVL